MKTKEILEDPTSSKINSKWLKSKEAADYLRMTVGALTTAVSRGEIKYYKWRRRLYFKQSDLDYMIEKGRV